MAISIGSVSLSSRVLLAPMSGVTDLPFRRQVRRFGGGLVASEMVASKQAEIAFDGPHDVERWEVRSRRNDIEVEYFVFAEQEADTPSEPEAPKSDSGECFAILTVRRGERVVPMSLGYPPRAGDVTAVAIHVPERDEALALLAELGWSRADAEDPKQSAEL